MLKQPLPSSIKGRSHAPLSDERDRQIVDTLALNARISFTELAHRVHLSTPALISRVRRLEGLGVLRGYHADIDLEKLGYPICALVFLTCTRQMERRFRDAAASLPEIMETDLIAGGPSFVIRAVFRSVDDMRDFLEALGQFGETTSMTVLESMHAAASRVRKQQ